MQKYTKTTKNLEEYKIQNNTKKWKYKKAKNETAEEQVTCQTILLARSRKTLFHQRTA